MVLGAQRTHDCGRVVDKPYLGITSCLAVMQKLRIVPLRTSSASDSRLYRSLLRCHRNRVGGFYTVKGRFIPW